MYGWFSSCWVIIQFYSIIDNFLANIIIEFKYVMMLYYFIWIVMMIVVWTWVMLLNCECCCGMIVREENYYRWVNAYFVYYWEKTLNIMLFLHWCIVTYIHYVVVVDEKGKLQSEQGGFVTCPEFEQGKFRVRAW